ncbi:tRNA uridine-5-carboxymethylaminomethyl(34) synthesis GTPase MnmE [Agathobaculum sp.]|uniref:tRNA uridine-5-carboxymethylaminomethyl(34) synthesis GTPase MnmE n=1 Tax=Agathobaculum sp. TaxID=2048138 RepID=UPI002A7FC9D6|nr:tRNA uridine-5-carboxymethylaminomethyl(34) synthesis GTPase MnmE [Agathobaculum sp.]MDY3618442.1 tRNA uridine-5-carboxymethylaminomethyl(34) synthesis GTPase MnmE [Agathobaculum sp.]
MNDTIAAISSAGGPIGLIRVSGERAAKAVEAVFKPKNGKELSDSPSQKLVYGALHGADGAVIDCCFAVVMRAPHTYTGEPMAEIQCHGSQAVLLGALDALFQQGVRQAEAGEFTRRAFLNGKMDLSGAEAVHDLITARTAEAAQNAAAQMMGAVGSPVREMREELLGMVAHFHAVVDFPDEDIDPLLFDEARDILHRTTSRLYHMAESYERGRILREGIPCVILGRPNAGKSTLLNSLLGRERAIVTDIPGTTRDLIEENVKVGEMLLRVTDTAGLRDTTDPIEQAGIDRAMAEASASALILAVFDGSQPLGDEDMLVLARSAGQRAVAVVNKSDLPQQIDLKALKKHFKTIVPLSAKLGDGLDKLLSAIPKAVGLGMGAHDGALITNARQAAALARAAERCEAALYAAQSGMTPDAVVMDAEGALAALGEITGETVTEAVVTRIFSDFCVGK